MFQTRHLNHLHDEMLKIFDDLSGDSCTLTPAETVIEIHRRLGQMFKRGNSSVDLDKWNHEMNEKEKTLGIGYRGS